MDPFILFGAAIFCIFSALCINGAVWNKKKLKALKDKNGKVDGFFHWVFLPSSTLWELFYSGTRKNVYDRFLNYLLNEGITAKFSENLGNDEEDTLVDENKRLNNSFRRQRKVLAFVFFAWALYFFALSFTLAVHELTDIKSVSANSTSNSEKQVPDGGSAAPDMTKQYAPLNIYDFLAGKKYYPIFHWLFLVSLTLIIMVHVFFSLRRKTTFLIYKGVENMLYSKGRL